MSISKQSVLGAVLLLVGSGMLFSMVNQTTTADNEAQAISEIEAKQDEVTLTAVDASGNELSTDIETEKRIAEEKQKERENRVKQQEQQAKAFLAEQDINVSNSNNNNQQNQNSANTSAKPQSIVKPNVNSRIIESKPETILQSSKATTKPVKTIEKTKSAPTTPKQILSSSNTSSSQVKQSIEPNYPPAKPITYYAKKGDGLIMLAKEYKIPLEVLAEANDMHILDDLMYNQKIIIPSKTQVAKLQGTAKKKQAEREAVIEAKNAEKRKKAAAKAAEEKKAKEAAELLAKQKAAAKKELEAKQAQKSRQATKTAQQKLNEARKTVRKENAKGTFGVQVALAADQAKADEIAKDFRKAGYKTKTSQTSRGVRVIVGPERGKVAALALKDKINSDPKVKTHNGWVLYWR